jgi:Lactate racemase N-terminal domain
MQVEVEFGDERVGFELPAERVVGVWRGPRPIGAADVKERILSAIESPIGFPPLRQAVVPGDRVAIPLDPNLSDAAPVLAAVCETLQGAGVDASDIQVLAANSPLVGWDKAVPTGVSWAVHDPYDRVQLAYLANSPQGRRIYLNRSLTDADCVIPIGRLGFDSVFGYAGPWSVIFPGLSDTETLRSLRSHASDAPPDRTIPRATLVESANVSWLLGSQFQLGILEGVGGIAQVFAGLDSAVRDAAALAVDQAWAYRSERRAELVVVGIGRPGVPVGVADLAEGLTTGTRLVQHGGKIVALSRAGGPIGPAVQRLTQTDEPKLGMALLKGLEGEDDYLAARQLARALAWADIYLLSALSEDDVDGLGMIAISRPEEAGRLAAKSGSCMFVGQADSTRAEAGDDSD